MRFTDEQLFGRGVRKRLVRKVADAAGTYPGETLLDLHSPDGFLAAGLARAITRGHVLTDEDIAWEGDAIEADEGELALVTGAWLHPDDPLDWSPDLAAELHRVLAPKGRVLLLLRAPSRRTAVPRTVPETALDDLRAVGFRGVAERPGLNLLDGSEVRLIEATRGFDGLGEEE